VYSHIAGQFQHMPRATSFPCSQRGVALVSVLLIVAILLAVTSRLMATHNLVINQHQNTFEQNQALQYAFGAETLARQALYVDFNTTGQDVDHMGELWAQQTMPFELDEGGFLEAQLRDLNGCLNINGVVGSDPKTAKKRFKQLLQNLSLPLQIADTWTDWVDGDDVLTGFGAEDSEYLIAQPAYRTPNHIVADISELYLLQNIEREQLDILLPHICLLPIADSQLNINTINAQTLASLDSALSLETAQSIAEADRSYANVQEFTTAFPDFAATASALSVTSEYFLLHAQAQVGSSSVTLQSLLHRDVSSGNVTVLRRDFGKLFRSNLTLDIEES